jgi:hypothetical protein
VMTLGPRSHMGHARACLPKRAELNHERSTPRVRRARDHARAHSGARHSSGAAPPLCLHVASCAPPKDRFECCACRIRHAVAVAPRAPGVCPNPRRPVPCGVAVNKCCDPLREAPDGFQRLGRRTSAQSRGPVYDSATTRHSQARMCSSVCTHPFMAPPSPHMART